MPEKKTIARANQAKRAGKAPSTQAGAFVKEEMDHIRQGKHGAKNAKQAIAIGLSKARRSGVALKPPAKGTVSDKSRKSTQSAFKKGQSHAPISKTRSAASKKALKKEPTSSASHTALSRHAKSAAKKRSPAQKSASARKAVATKGHVKHSVGTKKVAPKKAPAKKAVSSKRAVVAKGSVKRTGTAKKAVASHGQAKRTVAKKAVTTKAPAKRTVATKKPASSRARTTRK